MKKPEDKLQLVRNCLLNISVFLTFLFLGIGLLSTSIQNAIGIGFLGLPAGVVITIILHWNEMASNRQKGGEG